MLSHCDFVIMCFLWLLSNLSQNEWKKTIKDLKDGHDMENLATYFYNKISNN